MSKFPQVRTVVSWVGDQCQRGRCRLVTLGFMSVAVVSFIFVALKEGGFEVRIIDRGGHLTWTGALGAIGLVAASIAVDVIGHACFKRIERCFEGLELS